MWLRVSLLVEVRFWIPLEYLQGIWMINFILFGVEVAVG